MTNKIDDITKTLESFKKEVEELETKSENWKFDEWKKYLDSRDDKGILWKVISSLYDEVENLRKIKRPYSIITQDDEMIF